MPSKRGLYANIHAKRKRIAAGSDSDFRKSEKTTKRGKPRNKK